MMIEPTKEKKRNFSISFTATHFFITRLNSVECLKVRRTNLSENEILIKSQIDCEIVFTSSFDCLLGAITFLNCTFLVVGISSEFILNFNGNLIFKVRSVDMIDVERPNQRNANQNKNGYGDISKQIEDIKNRICKEFTNGFYYSYTYDITSKFSINSFKKTILSLKDFDLQVESGTSKYMIYSMIQPFIIDNSVNSQKKENLGLSDHIFKWFPYCIQGVILLKDITELTSNNSESKLENGTNNQEVPTLKCQNQGRSSSQKHKKESTMLLFTAKIFLGSSKNIGRQGINEKGFFSCFYETEFIILKNGRYMDAASYLQLNSSIPLPYYVSKDKELNLIGLKLLEPEESTQILFESIISRLYNNYNSILLLNAISTKTPDDYMILTKFEENLKKSETSNKFRYYHTENSQTSPANLLAYENTLISVLRPVLDHFEYYHSDNRLIESISNQKGTMLISNTAADSNHKFVNIVTAFYVFKKMILDCFNLNIEYGAVEFAQLILPKFNLDNLFNQLFELDIKDCIKSTHSKEHKLCLIFFSLCGKGIKLVENEVNIIVEDSHVRGTQMYLINSLRSRIFDADKSKNKDYNSLRINLLNQSTICAAISGRVRLPDLKAYNSKIHNEFMRTYSNSILDSVNLNIRIFTFNCGCASPNNDLMSLMLKKLNHTKGSVPDILIFGLQEIVDLKFFNIVLNSNNSQVTEWKESLSRLVDEFTGKKYELIHLSSLVGIMLIVFCEKKLSTRIEYQDSKILRLGFAGILGNKGCLIYRFNYKLTSIAVVCAHLEAGAKKNKIRLNQIKEILECEFSTYNSVRVLSLERRNSFEEDKYFREELLKHYKACKLKIKDHDVCFIFGDLNFRVNQSYQEALALIKENNIRELLQHDQLMQSIHIFNFMEPLISFLPTYKFKLNSLSYTEKKMRTPSWCDRIMYKHNESCISNMLYDSIPEVGLSDHKPVISEFVVGIKQHNSMQFKALRELHETDLMHMIREPDPVNFLCDDNACKVNYEVLKSRNKAV